MSDIPGSTPPPPPARPSDPVPKELLGLALKQIRDVLRGNGVPPASVTVKSFSGAVLDFEAYEVFRVAPTVSEKYVNGKQQGKTVSSEAELRREIQRTVDRAATDPSVRPAIHDYLRKRPDLGFGLDRQMVPLPGIAAQYVLHVQCGACHGSKTSPCAGCRGTARQPCTKCKGQRDMPCPVCNGKRTVARGSAQVSCTNCAGRGRVGCNMCRQTGQIACTRCRGSGKMPCPTCGAMGWRSLIASLSFNGEGHFDYDRAALPDGLSGRIDRTKAELVTGGHAQVRLIEDRARLQDLDKLAQPGDVIVPYHVRLPHGRIVFAIKNMEAAATLYGGKPVLSGLPPFLEKTAGKGLRLLAEAAATKGDIATPLGAAVRTRLVADTVAAAASTSRAKAVAGLRRRYPVGIRTSTFDHLVRQAEICLRNLTRLPRYKGFAAGVAVCAALDAAWLIAPLRAQAVMQAGPVAAIAGDALLPVVGGIVAALAIRQSCAAAIQKVLGKIQNGKRKKLMPKSGQSMLYGVAGSLAAWMVMLQAAAMTGHAPDWYAALLRMIGL